MLLYFLSVITISSVQSLAIGYPYRTLLTYGSTRYPIEMPAAQGFLIYVDNMGIERIVSYNYAQPVYAIHQINNDNSEIPLYQKYEQGDSSEFKNIQQAHFRAWCLQQYQVLKREIDLLQAEGKEPSIEMIRRFHPLEKIALTSDYSTIAELPEIKALWKEHLNIWNQVAMPKSVAANTIASESIEIMTAKKLANEIQVSDNSTLNDQSKANNTQSLNKNQSAKNELSFSKFANEEDKIKPEAGYANKADVKRETNPKELSNTTSAPPQQQSEVEKINSQFKANIEANRQDDRIDATHLPISNEQNSKDAQKQHLTYDYDIEMKKQADNEYLESGVTSKQKQNTKAASNLNSVQVKYLDTPQIIKAHDANMQLQANKDITTPRKIHSDLERIIAKAPAIFVPKQLVDTFEAMRARDEHLRIVNEAISKANFAQAQYKQ